MVLITVNSLIEDKKQERFESKQLRANKPSQRPFHSSLTMLNNAGEQTSL